MKGEIGSEPKSSKLFPLKCSTMRFAHIFNEWNVPVFECFKQRIRQAVETLDMGQKYCFGLVCKFSNNLLIVHTKVSRIDVYENRLKAILNYRNDVRHPGKRRNDDFSHTVQMLYRGHGDKIGVSVMVRHPCNLHSGIPNSSQLL